MKILLAGSHGLIGSALMARLQERGDDVTRMVRSDATKEDVLWDPSRGMLDTPRLNGYDAIIHLAGASIGEKRLTARQKERIWDSRVVSTEVLAKAIATIPSPPKVFLCASAVGYYGNRGDELLIEGSEPGEGFFPELCKQWEEAAQEATKADVRVINTRSGVVQSVRGGSLERQLPIFKLGIAGRLGSGQQWLSWISLDDEVDAMIHALDNESISGPVNLVSPEPVTNEVFTYTLALLLHRPAFIPVPRWMMAVSLGADLTDELLLTSQRAHPEKLLDNGFEFTYPNLRDALQATLDELEQPEDTSAEDDESGGETDRESNGPNEERP